MEIIFCVKRSSEGSYEARAVGHAIFTQADTLDLLKQKISDAVCHFGEQEASPVIRLVEVPSHGRSLGSSKGQFTVPEDFNDPLPKDIEDLFWE